MTINMPSLSPPDRAKLSILMVCMGNICRSPTAHGVMAAKLAAAGLSDAVRVDSAGTHNYHPGEQPDGRSMAHAAKRGYDLSDQRARSIAASDFRDFDLILAMDWDNLALTEQRWERAHRAYPELERPQIRRLVEFCQTSEATVVPDPYDGNAADFAHVLDLVEDACNGLLVYVQSVLASQAKT